MTLDVRTDITETKAALESLQAETKWVARTTAKYVGYALKKWITKRIGLTLGGRRSGGAALTGAKGGKLKAGDTGRGLYGSIYFKARQQGGVVSTALSYYGEPLEKGWTVKAKGKGYLTFRGSDGTWKKVHEMKIPAKHWYSRAEQGFDESSEMKKAIDAPLNAAIKKAGLA
jgi:hypothetical protein